ncbi:uncharacterized protein CCR75_003327 [Bremia lactucae]|uniref:DNA-directed RNA polymerase I subunit RPA43 n=1 Tax=Bremia lactucae TaxID=4779 RepID=A0A976ILJ6_BRELC|nr:hypothetical protein CCR75_003323 [Bremia lactucae]TDH73983.1 hypothetical protein CCR75_003327 [Bremia lactucae]
MAFVLCKVRHRVSLSPCHAEDARAGIEQNLNDQLMQYSEPLKGVVLSFSEVQLDKPYGVIVNEMPYIHCKVLADALVFRPKKGMILRGVVNKIGSNHIGMLIAGVFNGSVAGAELPVGYVHNYSQDCWLAKDGSSIAVENDVQVKVLRVHVASGMIAIEATMRFDGAGFVKDIPSKKKKSVSHLNLAEGEPLIQRTKTKKTEKVAEPVETLIKKHKHDKHADREVTKEVAELTRKDKVHLKKQKKNIYKDVKAKKAKKHKKSKHV